MLCMKEMRAYSICQYLGHQEVDNKKEIFCFNPSLDLGLGSEKKKKVFSSYFERKVENIYEKNLCLMNSPSKEYSIMFCFTWDSSLDDVLVGRFGKDWTSDVEIEAET